MNKKTIGILIGIIVIVCAAVFGGIYATRNIGKSDRVLSEENAEKRLDNMVDVINPETGTPVKSPIEYDSVEDEAAELPDIDTCPVEVEATTQLCAEISPPRRKQAQGPTAGSAKWQRNSTAKDTRWTGRVYLSGYGKSTAGRRLTILPPAKLFRRALHLPACSG